MRRQRARAARDDAGAVGDSGPPVATWPFGIISCMIPSVLFPA